MLRLQFESFRSFIEQYSSRISEEGMFLATDSVRPIGSSVEFEVSLSDDFRLLHGVGEVVWKVDPGTAEHPAGMAVRFKDTDEPSRRLIARLVDNHRKAGGEPFVLGQTPIAAFQGAGGTPETAGPPAAAPAPPAAPPEGGPAPPAAGAPPAPPPSEVPEIPAVLDLAPLEGAEIDLGAAAVPGPPLEGAPAELPPLAAEREAAPPAAGTPAAPDLGAIDDLLTVPELTFDGEPAPAAPEERAAPPVPPAIPPAAPEERAAPPVSPAPPAAAPEEPAIPPPAAPAGPDFAMPAGEPEPTVSEAGFGFPPAPASAPLRPPGYEEPEPEVATAVEIAGAASASSRPAWLKAALVVAALAVAAFAASYFFGDTLRSWLGSGPTTEVAEGPGAEPPRTPPKPEAAPEVPEPAVEPAAPAEELPAAEPRAPEAAPKAAPEVAPEAAEPVPPAPAEPAAPRAAPAPVAVERITWETSPGETVLVLWANGPISERGYELLRVESPPPREVIKLFGASRRYARGETPVGTPEVLRVRAGFHDLPGGRELHFVADLAAAGVEVAGAEVAGNQLRVRFTSR